MSCSFSDQLNRITSNPAKKTLIAYSNILLITFSLFRNDSLKNYLLDYSTDSSKLFLLLDTDNKREKVRRRIQKILRDAGYIWERVGCHTFRHTFASHLVINGASIYDVQKLLGHRSISMTQVYAHLSEDATRRAVDLLNFRPINNSRSGLTSIKNQLKH